MSTAEKPLTSNHGATSREVKPYWTESLVKAKAAAIEKIKLKGIEPVGSYGITINYDDIDSKNRARRGFNCTRCCHKWYAIPRYGKGKEGWEPRCPICMRRPGIAITHQLLFPQGTLALYGKRHPEERHQVAIQCRGCFEKESVEKYVFDNILRRYTLGVIAVYANLIWLNRRDLSPWSALYRYLSVMQYWDELCTECRVKRGSILRIVEDKSQDNGVVALFSLETGQGVPIFHPACRHIRTTDHDTALALLSKGLYSDICRSCNYSTDAYRRRVKELQSVRSDSDQLLTIVRAVINVWNEIKNLNMSLDENLRLVTKIRVAEKLNLGDAGSHASSVQLGTLLKALDVDKMFKDGTSFFREFRQAILNAHQRSFPEKAIVSLLILHLEGCGVPT